VEICNGVARERQMKVGYFVCDEGSKAVGERQRYLQLHKVRVKRIYGVRVCLRFATGAWGRLI